MKISKISYFGVEAVELVAGDYQAVLIPSMGANLIRLYHRGYQADILHAPSQEEMDTFVNRPQIFGFPLLFPPNRIADGQYSYKGREYRFPITIAQHNHYHHGILKSQPFVVTYAKTTEEYAEVECTFFSNLYQDAVYKNFPHTFTCRLTYRLSAKGLRQRVAFTNHSSEEMPLGVGFHSAFKVPFIEGTSADDVVLRMSVDKEWELNERLLPTEKLVSLSDQDQALRKKGLPVNPISLSASYTSQPFMEGEELFHGAILEHVPSQTKVVYKVDPQYKHWTLWNNGGGAGFVCPEPQTWIANAPNMQLDPSITGFRSLEKNETWMGESFIYITG